MARRTGSGLAGAPQAYRGGARWRERESMTDGRDPAATEYASILSPHARHTLIDAGEALLAWYEAEAHRHGPGLGFVRLAPGGGTIAARRVPGVRRARAPVMATQPIRA